jgi:hypothetical protein
MADVFWPLITIISSKSINVWLKHEDIACFRSIPPTCVQRTQETNGGACNLKDPMILNN